MSSDNTVSSLTFQTPSSSASGSDLPCSSYSCSLFSPCSQRQERHIKSEFYSRCFPSLSSPGLWGPIQHQGELEQFSPCTFNLKAPGSFSYLRGSSWDRDKAVMSFTVASTVPTRRFIREAYSFAWKVVVLAFVKIRVWLGGEFHKAKSTVPSQFKISSWDWKSCHITSNCADHWG